MLLESRGPGFSPPASELEQLLRRAVAQAQVPGVVFGMEYPGRRAVGSCVDGAVPAAKLILEADGRRWHRRVEDMRRDRLRDNEAARRGWQTMRFLWEDLVEPTVVVAQLRDTVALRRAVLAAAG